MDIYGPPSAPGVHGRRGARGVMEVLRRWSSVADVDVHFFRALSQGRFMLWDGAVTCSCSIDQIWCTTLVAG